MQLVSRCHSQVQVKLSNPCNIWLYHKQTVLLGCAFFILLDSQQKGIQTEKVSNTAHNSS